MNISIYYYRKRIVICPEDQSAHNQMLKNIDELDKSDVLREFMQFINQDQQQELWFVADDPEKSLERFRQSFKYIEAAGGLICQDERYLFIYRLGTWDLPKGKLEKGEGPREGAIRECEEECGITRLSILKELHPTYHMYEHPKAGYALKKTHWFLMSSGHLEGLVPQTEEMIERVEWFGAEQIEREVMRNTYPAIKDVVREGQAK